MINVVIIGGGFAGVNLASGLAGRKEVHVTLVDKNNYNFFPPLLYQTATGFLEPSNISYPYRKLLQKSSNIHFRLGELIKVIPAENKVLLSSGTLPYDHLVIATGATTNYFGMRNVQQNALPMKTLNDALHLRNHLLQQMEQASIVSESQQRQNYLNIVVAGGGPTGVEISGMLADIRRHIFPKDYPELAGFVRDINIYLVDGADAVLKPMSAKSQQYAQKSLTAMGVNVRLGMQVKDYVDDTVIFANGERIGTKTLVWAAGVTGSVFDGIPMECYGRGRRLIVDEYNEVVGMKGICAIGDCCIRTTDKVFPNGHPQLAQVGIQQGTRLAGNLLNSSIQRPRKPFSYYDKGSMAIIGRNKAVVDLPGGKVHFNGFIAWLLWLFVHLLSLISGRNRVTTLYNWAGAWFSRDQSLRMIIRPAAG